jgi:hypothetical protein
MELVVHLTDIGIPGIAMGTELDQDFRDEREHIGSLGQDLI